VLGTAGGADSQTQAGQLILIDRLYLIDIKRNFWILPEGIPLPRTACPAGQWKIVVKNLTLGLGLH